MFSTKIHIQSLLFIALVFCNVEVQSQQFVWPGDINDNGKTTNVDVLYLGVGFGTTGPARDSINSSWSEQTIPSLWNQDFPGNPVMPINYAYADCNGDGFIDQDDLLVIQQNYGLENGGVIPDDFILAGIGEPILSFGPVDTIITAQNTQLVFNIEVADAAVDFYGIAFSIEYDTAFVVAGTPAFTTNPQWINPDQVQLLELGRDNGFGTYDVAICRTNQSPVSGMGGIGTFSLIIEDNLIDIVAPGPDFKLNIKDIRLIDEELNTTPVNGDSVLIDLITFSENIIKDKNIKVFPNPAKDYLHLESKDLKVEQIECYNSLGQVLFSHRTIYDYSTRIPLPDLVAGAYVLKIYTEEGIVVRQFVKNDF